MTTLAETVVKIMAERDELKSRVAELDRLIVVTMRDANARIAELTDEQPAATNRTCEHGFTVERDQHGTPVCDRCKS